MKNKKNIAEKFFMVFSLAGLVIFFILFYLLEFIFNATPVYAPAPAMIKSASSVDRNTADPFIIRGTIK